MTKLEAENWLVKIDAHKDHDEVMRDLEYWMLWAYVSARAEDGDAVAQTLCTSRGIAFDRGTD